METAQDRLFTALEARLHRAAKDADPRVARVRALMAKILVDQGCRQHPTKDHAAYRQCQHCGVWSMRIRECPCCHREMGR